MGGWGNFSGKGADWGRNGGKKGPPVANEGFGNLTPVNRKRAFSMAFAPSVTARWTALFGWRNNVQRELFFLQYRIFLNRWRLRLRSNRCDNRFKLWSFKSRLNRSALLRHAR